MQDTWVLIPPPPNMSVLGSKWVYKVKTNVHDSTDLYKAHLIMQKNQQEHGICYENAFNLLAKMPTIRILLIIVVHNNLDVHHLDVSNVFLH